MPRILTYLGAIALCALAATQAAAGAWPRGKGRTFLSTSTLSERQAALGGYTQTGAFYIERGLTDRLTAGLDIGGDGVTPGKTVAFLRWPLWSAERDTKFAAEVGLGRIAAHNALRPGLSLGRGVTVLGHPGWLALDGRTVLNGRPLQWEGEATFGLSPRDWLKAILQLQGGGGGDGQVYARFAPSLIIRHAPGRYYELGVTAGLVGAPAVGFKVGIWQEF